MFPIGKLTLAIIGLRLGGANGFLWGMFLGHMLIDRTLVRKLIKQYLSNIDDNIRLLLPYRYYKYYNRIENNVFGVIWGGLLGSLAFGFYGFIILFILGHFIFDMPENRWSGRFRSIFESFWNQHWCKILGAIIGYSFKSNILIFIGVVIGFFCDNYRFGNNKKKINLKFINKFWSNLNLMKFYLHSSEAKHFSFIQAMAGLAAKISKADGVVSENEIRIFKKMFELNYEENSKIADIYNKAKKSPEGYERFAKQLKLIAKDNLELKENIIENLFKIAAADGMIHSEQLGILKTVAYIIELPDGNFELIHEHYKPRPSSNSPLQEYYDILEISPNSGNDEIKARWKELIIKWHPDNIQAHGGTASEIERYTLKMAEINNAYQHIMKSRKI